MITWLLDWVARHNRRRTETDITISKAEQRMEHVEHIRAQEKRDIAEARRIVERLSVQGRIAGDYRRELRRSE